jgi:hypothetical protein
MEFLKVPYLVLYCLLYINDLPKTIFNISNPILYADDTSMIITCSEPQMFKKDISNIIIQLNRWQKVIYYY